MQLSPRSLSLQGLWTLILGFSSHTPPPFLFAQHGREILENTGLPDSTSLISSGALELRRQNLWLKSPGTQESVNGLWVGELRQESLGPYRKMASSSAVARGPDRARWEQAWAKIPRPAQAPDPVWTDFWKRPNVPCLCWDFVTLSLLQQGGFCSLPDLPCDGTC